MKRPLFAVLDCNNFFVSCEKVFRPDLEGKPVVVLSNNDGCAVSRSNEAKALGIPMGSPRFKYKDIYEKNGVVEFSANFSLYGDFSSRVFKLTAAAVPDVEMYSIDESFMRLDGLGDVDIEHYMRDLRAKIQKYTGIPVSIGVGPTKTLAKAAVEYSKKNLSTKFVKVLDSEEERERVLRWLPIGDVWGIGRRIGPRLREFGINTAWDYSKLSHGWVLSNLKSHGVKLHQELNGSPMYWLESERLARRKTIAATRSFGRDVTELHELEQAVASYIARASRKLRRQESVAKRIDVYARTSRGSFTRKQGFRSSAFVELPVATSDVRALTAAAVALVPDIYQKGVHYAKAGVLLSGISQEPQLNLMEKFDQAKDSHQKTLMYSLDSINKKWGDSTIRLGSEGIKQQWRGRRRIASPAYTHSWQELPVVKAT